MSVVSAVFDIAAATAVRDTTVAHGIVSPARIETCENIVRIGLAFFGAALAGRAWARLRSMA